jgi:predicted porin
MLGLWHHFGDQSCIQDWHAKCFLKRTFNFDRSAFMQPKPGHTATRLATSLLPAAVMSLCALSAHAQSSLTLYGRADLSVESVKGATSVTRVTSGNLTGSRLGLRGVEDLGDGIKAKFNLETGVRFDTGANNGASARFWDRQAWVGVSSNTLGELRLGRTDSALGTIVDRIGTQSYEIGRAHV